MEYLNLGRRGIHVAEYLTELPPREVLRERFHKALTIARARRATRTTAARAHEYRRRDREEDSSARA